MLAMRRQRHFSVLIACRNRLSRELLARYIPDLWRASGDDRECHAVALADPAYLANLQDLDEIVAASLPDVVVVNGQAACHVIPKLLARLPSLRILVYTQFESDHIARGLLALGACAVVNASAEYESIVDGIRACLDEQHFVALPRTLPAI